MEDGSSAVEGVKGWFSGVEAMEDGGSVCIGQAVICVNGWVGAWPFDWSATARGLAPSIL